MMIRIPQPLRPEKIGCHHQDPQASILLGEGLFGFLKDSPGTPVILCIGTDRSTGDALGPLVGTMLSQHSLRAAVYGTLKSPVHATNLQETLASVYREQENPLIIAVDACLGKLENVGYILLGSGPLKPGAGVNKDLPPVGDIHFTGVVNVGGTWNTWCFRIPAFIR